MNTRIMMSVGAALSGTVLGAPIAYDGFQYGTRPDFSGADGGSGWTSPWLDVASQAVSTTGGAGLAWPSLSTLAGAMHTPMGVQWDTGHYFRSFVPPPSGPLYFSYLIMPDATHGMYGSIRFGTYPAHVEFGMPRYSVPNYGMNVGRYGGAASNVPIQAGQPALLVVEIVRGTSTTRYNMFVNPRAQDPKPPFPSCFADLPGWVPLPAALEIVNDGGVSVDEIRIATTWEEAMGRQYCPADLDDGTMTGTKDGGVDINDLIFFLTKFELGDLAVDLDNDGDPAVGTPDGGVDINDLLFFLARFEAGC